MLSQQYILKYSGESIEDLSEIAKHYEEINGSLKTKLEEAILKTETDLLRILLYFPKLISKIFGAFF